MKAALCATDRVCKPTCVCVEHRGIWRVMKFTLVVFRRFVFVWSPDGHTGLWCHYFNWFQWNAPRLVRVQSICARATEVNRLYKNAYIIATPSARIATPRRATPRRAVHTVVFVVISLQVTDTRRMNGRAAGDWPLPAADTLVRYTVRPVPI